MLMSLECVEYHYFVTFVDAQTLFMDPWFSYRGIKETDDVEL